MNKFFVRRNSIIPVSVKLLRVSCPPRLKGGQHRGDLLRAVTSQEWTPHSPDLNPLNYSVWNILQEIVYEGRREPFANLKDLQNVIRDKWHDVDDQTVRKAILQWKRRLAEWRTYSAHFLLISWLIRITVTFWCSLRTTNNINDELFANIVLWRAILSRLYDYQRRGSS